MGCEQHYIKGKGMPQEARYKPDKEMKRFKNNDIIKHKGDYFECICADENNAVFAEVILWDGYEKRVSEKGLFAVSNNTVDCFKYEIVNDLPEFSKVLSSNDEPEISEDEAKEKYPDLWNAVLDDVYDYHNDVGLAEEMAFSAIVGFLKTTYGVYERRGFPELREL